MGGLFQGLGKAKISRGGLYFQPGEYVVDIERVTTVRSQRDKKDFFIIEATIVESDCPELKPGMQPSQAIDIDNIMGFPNIKGFLAAANGIDPSDEAAVEEALGEDKAEEAAEYAASEENPLKGLRLRLTCFNIQTKKGSDFTKHVWKPYNEAA